MTQTKMRVTYSASVLEVTKRLYLTRSRWVRTAIVDAADLARMLGLNRATVVKWVRAGRLRGHRVGAVRSRWRVRVRDFWALFEQTMLCMKPGARPGDRGLGRMLMAASVRVSYGDGKPPGGAWRR